MKGWFFIAVCWFAATTMPAGAQTGGDFFAGRTVSLIVAADAGGGYGLYARMLADHMGSHIPGKPAIVPQFMPGAGGAKAANHVYNVAPKDGTALGILLSPMPLAQFLRAGMRYDATKFSYIGRIADIVQVMNVRKDAPATTLAALKETEIIVGSTGRSSDTFVMPTSMNRLVGTKFKIVTGYSGTAPINLAMERNEVHGWVGTLGVIVAQFPALLDGSVAIQPVQFGLERDPRLKHVPTLTDLVQGADDKRVAEFIVAPTTLGRYVVAPPGVPEERIETLRTAFDATMADQTFQATLKKRNSDFNPMKGKDLQALVEKIASSPKHVIDAARDLLGTE